jgi:DNA helicase-2/ATP-dependent DNA helicase PcrA
VVKLEQNYRSTEAILRAASAVVGRNRTRHPKTLWTESRGGDPVVVRELGTEEEEASWLADTVCSEVTTGRRFGDIAVLYRVHALSRPIEEAFLQRRIPYVVYGGLRFYDRMEVKDALAYLRFVLNPDDPVALRRVVNTPPRGIGKSTLARVEDLATERSLGTWGALRLSVEEGHLAARPARAIAGFVALISRWQEAVGTVPLRELLARILDESGYTDALKAEDGERGKERLENLGELLNAAEAFENDGLGTAADFLDRAALVTDQDAEHDRAQAVTLMTLHSAKGLEYPVVFIAGLEEGVFPHQMSSDSQDELEEERRLCYVGITRARERLFLSRARVRQLYGAQGYVRLPSRFLKELPAGTYQAPARTPEAMRPPAPDADGPDAGRYWVPEAEQADYRVGIRVHHPRYGRGEVVAVQGRGPQAKVTVRFRAAGTRRFIAGLADLAILLDD